MNRSRSRCRSAGAAGRRGFSLGFTSLTPGAHASIPSVSVTRASSATVQTGTSTLAHAAVDEARVGRESDADAPALLIEESSTNTVLHSSAVANVSWGRFGGPTLATGTTLGPDGSTLCDTIEDSDAGAFVEVYRSNLNFFAGQYFSAWVKRLSGSTGLIDRHDTAVAVPSGSEWQRVKAGYVASGVGGAFGIIPAGLIGNLNVPTGKVAVYGAQADGKKFPLSAKPTEGSSATCAGDHVSIPGSAIRAGRLSLLLRCRPLGARADYDHALRVATASAATWVEIDQATGALSVCVQGELWESFSAISWGAGDTLELWVEAGGGTVASSAAYRLNGGTAISLGQSDSTQPACVLSDTDRVDVLCRRSSQQLSSWLESVRTTRPAWAAPSGSTTTPTELPVRVVLHGNSIVDSLNEANIETSLGARFSVEERGTPFLQISGMLLAGETGPIDAQFSPHTQTLVVVAWEATNSMAATLTADESTPAATVAELALGDWRAYVEGRRAAGAMVVALTCMKRGDLTGAKGTSFEAARQIFNAAMVSDATCRDWCIDIASHPSLQNPSDTLYFTDTLHLAAAGIAIAEALVVARIQQIFP